MDGENVRASYLLRGQETVSIQPAELPPLKATAEDLPLKVLYEDADVIAVDKPAGMVVHAGAGHTSGTLVNALLHHFGSGSLASSEMRPGIVHRLDRETSGVLIVARTDQAHQALSTQFRNRRVEKVYIALVHGSFDSPKGQVATPITRDPVRRTRMTTRLKTGRSALTTYKVLEEFGAFSLLEVRIGTGRTHQIRVHLASVGHPVVGDRLYGAPAKLGALPELGRFFLHAQRIRFLSPSRHEPITVESPLAPELIGFLSALRENTVRIKSFR